MNSAIKIQLVDTENGTIYREFYAHPPPSTLPRKYYEMLKRVTKGKPRPPDTVRT